MRVAINPCVGTSRWEVNTLREFGLEGLEPLRQPRFPKDKILHHAEDGSPEGILLGVAIDGRGFGNASTANAIGPFDQGDLTAGLSEVMRGYESVDASANDDYIGFQVGHKNLMVNIINMVFEN